jgi:hypothetical protein
MTTAINFYYTGGNITNYPLADLNFKEWLKMVEREQTDRNIMKNIIINRQWLHLLWEQGFTPADALKDVECNEGNQERMN